MKLWKEGSNLQLSLENLSSCLLLPCRKHAHSKRKGRCTHLSPYGATDLCVWSSWEPVSGICFLLETSIVCAVPYHLSLDFFLCHGNQRSWLGREGEQLLCQEPSIREIWMLSYMLDMSKHCLGKCCLTIWRCCLLKKIILCLGMSKVPVLQRAGTRWLQVFPIYPQWTCKRASIPLKGYRAKNKYTL